jgi:hypothetical protein
MTAVRGIVFRAGADLSRGGRRSGPGLAEIECELNRLIRTREVADRVAPAGKPAASRSIRLLS